MTEARILIVEDEGIAALDLQHRLTNLGYAVVDIVATGEEAVSKTEETCPDIVLMDIMLKGEIDGVTAAEQIHARLDIPIIFLTAYEDEETLRRAKQTEPYGYLVKPFKERDLHISIDMALYKHRMEKKLREREKWCTTLLSSIGDALIATDKNGLITFMNPVAERLTGWKIKDTQNKKLTEIFNIINVHTRKPVENPVEKVIREGVTVGLANHTILISREGKEIPIDDSAAPIIDERGNIIGIVLVFRDITEREKAEKEIEDLNKTLKHNVSELEAVNKNLEVFSYSVSHDLQAPLRALSGFSALLMKRYADKLDEKGRNYLDFIERGAKKMSKLIDGLINLSKVSRQALKQSKVDLSRLARSIIDELHKVTPSRRVEVQIADSLTVNADPFLMEIVLSNLLGNAWKFTSKTENARIEFGVSEDKKTYYIRDNGAGFNSEFKEKLFSFFQRLHSEREFEGSGLGLAIVERIIIRHGGKVWAEGEEGKGATVYFTL